MRGTHPPRKLNIYENACLKILSYRSSSCRSISYSLRRMASSLYRRMVSVVSRCSAISLKEWQQLVYIRSYSSSMMESEVSCILCRISCIRVFARAEAPFSLEEIRSCS